MTHLRKIGFAFAVLPRAFLVHVPHPKSAGKDEWQNSYETHRAVVGCETATTDSSTRLAETAVRDPSPASRTPAAGASADARGVGLLDGARC